MNLSFYRNLAILNGAVPALILAWDAWHGQLGANAVNVAIHITGLLSLVFLFLSLIITPLRSATGWNSLIAYRRALGVYAFVYAALHFGIYFGFDRLGSLPSTFDEIAKRRFLLVGFIALMLMLPLAVTSTNGMIRQLGAARWKLLHRLTYVVAILAVVHFYMQVKSDIRQPVAFAIVLTPLLAYRPIKHLLDKKDKSSRKPVTKSPPQKAAFFQGELVVSQIVQETHDVKTFRLTHPEQAEIPFLHLPGQYLTLSLTIDGKPVRRSYTIASAPTQRSYVELTIKRNPAGLVSQYLHDHLQPGNRLKIAAPAGKFHFDGQSADAVILISGGVGITPLMSILRYLTDRNWTGRIDFINVIRTPRDYIFHQELQQLAERFANLHVWNHYSKELPAHSTDKLLTNWHAESGYLSQDSLKRLGPHLVTAPIFLCGPDPMMDATCEQLLIAGVPPEHIATEEFVSPAATAAETEVSGASSRADMANATIASATVTFSRSGESIEITATDSILDAAESAGVSLSWECRSGICGQCKIRCTTGRVHMESRDALSPAEETQGYILACQAMPREMLVVVEA